MALLKNTRRSLKMKITKNYKLWLAVSVLLAALAALITTVTIQKYTGTVKTIVAKEDIQSAQIITGKQLEYKEVLRMNLYPDAVLKPEQIFGMVAKGFIPSKTVLRSSMFDLPATAAISGKIASIGENYRAVALPKQLSITVASTLNEDDIVDIYAKDKEKDLTAKRVAEDVQVIRCRYGEEGGEGVVLAIKQDEIEKVLPYFYEAGNITFVLKPSQPVSEEKKAATDSNPGNKTTERIGE